MAGRPPLEQGDQFIKSDMPADDGYSQNGYQGASSVTPGKTVSTNFLPELRAKTPQNSQTRTVDATPYKAANKGASAGPKVPGNNRPVWK
jgi:hypothetical protein